MTRDVKTARLFFLIGLSIQALDFAGLESAEIPNHGFPASVSVRAELYEGGDDETRKIPAHKPRKWKDQSGKYELFATITSYGGGKISLKKVSDGSVVRLDVVRLSNLDQSYLKVLFDEIGQPAGGETGSGQKSTSGRAGVLPGAKMGKSGNPKPLHGTDRISKVVPPDPGCPRCLGIGMVPLKLLQPISRKQGDRRDLGKELLGDCCPECQHQQDPLKFSDDSPALAAAIDEFHRKVEIGIGKKLERFETRYRVVHSELSERETAVVLKAINQFEFKLQQRFGHLLFSNSRRGEDDVLLVRQETYPQAVKLVRTDLADFDYPWDHLLRLHAFSVHRYSAALRETKFPKSIVDKTVFALATKQLGKAALWNEPPWLYSGFGAVMEYEVTRKNLVYVSSPPVDQSAQSERDLRHAPDFAENWDLQFRRRARAGESRPWEVMFELQFSDYQLIHDLQAKSMVKFLMSRPDRLTQLVQRLGRKELPLPALENAYGATLKELEGEWKKWVGFR